MLLFLSLKGKTLSCSHFPTELLSHFSPLLKAKSCSHSLSTSPLFPVSLKHTPVVIPTLLHHFINAALVITNVTSVLLNAINCQFSVFILLILSAASDGADHFLFLETFSFGHTVFCLLLYWNVPRLSPFLSFSNCRLFVDDIIQSHDYSTAPHGSLTIQTQHIQIDLLPFQVCSNFSFPQL